MTIKTVRDFKDEMMHMRALCFFSTTPEARSFRRKLEIMGARNMKTNPPNESFIDATVEIPDKEWGELMAEFQLLLTASLPI